MILKIAAGVLVFVGANFLLYSRVPASHQSFIGTPVTWAIALSLMVGLVVFRAIPNKG